MKNTISSQLDTTHLNDDLKKHTIRGGLITLIAQIINFTINLGATAILARLISPSDFGLIAMVTAVTGLLAMLKDAGLSMATVQQETITQAQVSNLFWINVTISFILMVAVTACSPLIGTFYSEPKLVPISIAIAATFLFDGFAVQHQALLRRQMRFDALVKIQFLSNSFALTVAIITAIAGMGYWALVMQIAVSQIVAAIFSWIHCSWIPSLPKRGVGTLPMIKFGGYLAGFSFINYFARNADNVLIGNFCGSLSLGLYSKAYNLLTFPLQQINRPITAVAIPALSRLQHDHEKFREFFIIFLQITSFITFPIIAWLIICRREIILLLLGPQWEGAVPIFGALAICAFFQPIGNIVGVLYIALGRSRRMFIWGVVSSTIIVCSFMIGLPYGPIGVAWAYSATISLLIIPQIKYAIDGTCLMPRDYWQGVKNPLLALTVSLLSGSTIHHMSFYSDIELVKVVVIGFTIFISYLTAIRFLDKSIITNALALIKRRDWHK